jgi:hypothetical protein
MLYFLYMLKPRYTERLGNKVVTVLRAIMVTQCTNRIQHEVGAGSSNSVETWICQQQSPCRQLS